VACTCLIWLLNTNSVLAKVCFICTLTCVFVGLSNTSSSKVCFCKPEIVFWSCGFRFELFGDLSLLPCVRLLCTIRYLSCSYQSLDTCYGLTFIGACRFSSVAYLQQIWWFEVDGEIDFPFPVGTYSIFFRLQLGRSGKWFGRRVCNTEQVHGWDIKPVRFQLWTEDGQYSSSQCMLTERGNWIHYHAGDVVVRESNRSSTKIKFSMTQIDCTHTKGGLSLDSVVVYPSSCKDQLKRF